jgi:hypothetical protein
MKITFHETVGDLRTGEISETYTEKEGFWINGNGSRVPYGIEIALENLKWAIRDDPEMKKRIDTNDGF